ncbi:fatty acid cis/trans isomerase CTI [Mariprofundus micogutta]|uniref:Fatty acid cis/trans isomerase CTI n=1 Tax=Mariprofundus micogutta TaxID=1921010 RepID=A0A1L8CK91_9PROT|nr:fatty acid cis/trans isomerase [Mariprofundus micogutta]GAV19311.1 fatty acid cis/trans isomerase CTI [Mariprofundus micogutta]
MISGTSLYIMLKNSFNTAAILILASVLALPACSSQSTMPEVHNDDIQLIKELPAKTLTYNDIKPTLERRCIVCHGCYDAPCQLKLSAFEGVRRGANKLRVYDKKRFTWQQPSRLFIDANTTNQWREMNFFSVLAEEESLSAEENLQNSLLYQMLSLKKRNPLPESGMLPDDLDVSLDRKQVCSGPGEFNKFAADHPLWGMPYAVPALSDEEYKLLVQWLAQGAKASKQVQPSEEIVMQINRWEAFFNGSSNKQQLVSRYIYEHLVLGHLHFKGSSDREFFRLVRSRTPAGQAIDEIPTTRPYDDPQGRFYYRLRPYEASIVEKNHIVYELSDARMQRYEQLFMQPDYEVKTLPDYNPGESSSYFERKLVMVKKWFGYYKDTPFKTFATIPAKIRYQFLLDDARFFINGFIKGPVCRGQSALSSIEDHFWVFFLKPENPPAPYSQHGLDGKFLTDMDEYLHLPTELGDTKRLFTGWIKYWPDEQRYMQAKMDYYNGGKQKLPQLPIDKALEYFIWDGVKADGAADSNAALTIFRHFDSASVHFGLHGKAPETAWVIDYPVFERLHYLLVAGFNPFGTLGHQLGARLYMDFLRIEGEDNFLYFLPTDARKQLYKSWHEIDRKTVPDERKATRAWLEIESVSGYKTVQPQQELLGLLSQHVASVRTEQDDLNRCDSDACVQSASDRSVQRLVKTLRGKILEIFPEVSYLRVGGEHGKAYTLIHNKSYRSDTFAKEVFDRSDADMEQDTLTVMRGLAGSYPNFFFDVKDSEVDAFVETCAAIQDRDDYDRMVALYGVRRTNPAFWTISDWFQDFHARTFPVESGLLDLSRYKDR